VPVFGEKARPQSTEGGSKIDTSKDREIRRNTPPSGICECQLPPEGAERTPRGSGKTHTQNLTQKHNSPNAKQM
ncbi:MAG: hypothetical protein RR552_07955, partial [Oscillospiraceae bacterium]